MNKITTVNPAYASLLEAMLDQGMTLTKLSQISGVSRSHIHAAFFGGFPLLTIEWWAVREALCGPELQTSVVQDHLSNPQGNPTRHQAHGQYHRRYQDQEPIPLPPNCSHVA
jgi:hypothetical protein